MKAEQQLAETLLTRINNRASNPDDAKAAAVEMRELSRSVGFSGAPLVPGNPFTLHPDFAMCLETRKPQATPKEMFNPACAGGGK